MKALLCLMAAIATSAAALAAEPGFALTSESFQEGAVLSTKFAMEGVAGGRNLSPELSWSSPPAGTKGFALTCIDAHPEARKWVHWMAFLPADCLSLPEGASINAMPKGAAEFGNSFRRVGWGGPMPPPGSGIHKYVFTVYALDVEPPSLFKASSGTLAEERFLKGLEGHILGKASITGIFVR